MEWDSRDLSTLFFLKALMFCFWNETGTAGTFLVQRERTKTTPLKDIKKRVCIRTIIEDLLFNAVRFS